MARLENIIRQIKEIQKQLYILQRVNQTGVMQFGNIILDGANNIITVGSGEDIELDGGNKRILIKDSGGINRILLRGTDGAFKISDPNKNVLTAASADLALEFDPATGNLKSHGDIINTSGEWFSHVSVEHFWTGSGSYIDRTGAFFELNGDNFNNQLVYFEGVMAVEQSGRTAYLRIYNVTNSNVLAGSEITSTRVGVSNPERVRSSALTIPTGSKNYKLQIKQSPAGNGGDNAHFYAARLVHVQQ